MGLFGLLKASPAQSNVFKDIVARYHRLRPVRLRLNNELTSRLSRDVIEEGAKRIGIFHNGTIVFDNKDETCVLMDYCIYNVYRKGRNAIEQYLCDCPPAADSDWDSDEMACLKAMQQATYALVAVLGVEPGVGCHVRNLYSEETGLLVDMGFSNTAQPGAVLATRLLDFGDFVAASGAALPLGILNNDKLDELQRELRTGTGDGHSDPAPLIRGCLQRGASSRIRYEGENTQHRSDVQGSSRPVENPAQRRQALAKRYASKAQPNRRCRCGSGKMFKNCCGKR